MQTKEQALHKIVQIIYMNASYKKDQINFQLC